MSDERQQSMFGDLVPKQKPRRPWAAHGKQNLSPLIGELAELLVEFDLKARLWTAIRVNASIPGYDLFVSNTEKRIDYKVEVTSNEYSKRKKLKGRKLFDILAFVESAFEVEYLWNDGTEFDPDKVFGESVLFKYLDSGG